MAQILLHNTEKEHNEQKAEVIDELATKATHRVLCAVVDVKHQACKHNKQDICETCTTLL